MARKLPVLILAKLMAKCTVVHVHTPSIAELVDHRPNWLFPLTCQLADRLVALSPRWARELRAAGASTPITVIPNPVSIPKVPAPCDDNGGRKNVLFVGKLEPRKGYADLIRAAAIVLKAAPETEFFLVGHGELDEARRLARRLGIEKSIRLTGWQEGGALTTLYQTATVFCLPSYDEGLPMSVLEAMGWSLPVVTTAVGGIPDVVVDGRNGIFVLPGQVKELAASLLAVLQLTPADRNRMGAAARATVLRDCDPARISLTLGELYNDLLEHRSGAAITQ
jgi:glycosyltransferase involved in cell wall biosynthesis